MWQRGRSKLEPCSMNSKAAYYLVLTVPAASLTSSTPCVLGRMGPSCRVPAHPASRSRCLTRRQHCVCWAVDSPLHLALPEGQVLLPCPRSPALLPLPSQLYRVTTKHGRTKPSDRSKLHLPSITGAREALGLQGSGHFQGEPVCPLPASTQAWDTG